MKKGSCLKTGIVGIIAALALCSCKPGNSGSTIRPSEPPFAHEGGFAYSPSPLEKSVLSNLEPDYVFDMGALPSITITVTTSNWNMLLYYLRLNIRSEETVMADFTFEKNGTVETVSNIGFRVRGNLSRNFPEHSYGPHDPVNPNWSHAHFRIDFNDYGGGRFHGLQALTLKWFKDDRAYCREIYCYDLFQRFGVWTAARVGYTRLTIKIAEDPDPAYFGVYAMIEPIDRSYLRARFADRNLDNGNLWKCLWGANMTYPVRPGQAGFEYIDPYSEQNSVGYPYDLKVFDKGDWSNRYQAFTNVAFPQLLEFTRNLNKKTGEDFVAWITNAMDVDLFLKTYAVSVIVGMWDDYWANNGNNYYFYFDGAGKAYFIPYDYDNSMGISLDQFVPNTGTQDPLNWNEHSNFRAAPLIEKILEVPAFRDRYKFYLCQLIEPSNGLFSYKASVRRIEQWNSVIDRYVSNDTGEDMVIRDSSYTSWAQLNYYKLLDGDDSGNAGSPPGANYFRTRIRTICEYLGLDCRRFRE